MTGLVNRREFERRLREAMDAAQTGDAAHALCYLDLDRFKVVNDTCGHTAGDNMLREVATIIKDAVRDSDTAGRIGGDEFALLLVGCPLEKARQIADDVVRAVNDYRFIWKDKIFNIGVSIGLVEIGRGGGSIEDIMNSAGFGVLRREEAGRGARARVLRARGSERASQRRDPLAAEAAGRAARQSIRALLPAHRAGAEQRRARPGTRGVRTSRGRGRATELHRRRSSFAPPSATG